ncbi:MAG TPA: hypothetical protein VJ821_00905 [Anaerolineales bacterium]|nr:hypothetical protein [Anaerolineales bacterium]
MDNQPSFDRTLLPPILIGVFSILGILIILLIGRVSASRASIATEPTETPFKYIYLGTEPIPSAALTVETEDGLLTGTPFEGEDGTPTPRPAVVTPTLGTATRGTPNTTSGPPGDGDDGPPINNTSPANATSTGSNPGSGPPPLSPGTYDDTQTTFFLYDGPSWNPSTGGGLCGNTSNTLHVSDVGGSSVSFSFIGTEVRIRYQAGPSLGEITITIDSSQNLTFTVDQSDVGGGNEWASPTLSNATHTVEIVHEEGSGSVNIDCVIIPTVAPTGTPTPTPTRTPTP